MVDLLPSQAESAPCKVMGSAAAGFNGLKLLGLISEGKLLLQH